MDERLTLLLSADRIAGRVADLAGEIDRDYSGRPGVLVVAVLNGAAFFLADLVRKLTIPVTIDYLRASSYGSATTSTGSVKILKDLEISPYDRDVLIVEDVVDTGLTARFLIDHIQGAGPRSLAVCTLLDKPSRRQLALQADYVGFTIGDEFVVGYGLDFDNRYRQLAAIYELAFVGEA
jgi:hypoxanthine phosphoribosyltransferase